MPVNNTGIAWPSDKQMKFKNPSGMELSEGKRNESNFLPIFPHAFVFNSAVPTAYKGFSKPQNWRKNIWELDPNNPDNNGFQNEDLIVWMRTAALPTFRKLYRRLDRSQQGYQSGLLAGNYTLLVSYSKSTATAAPRRNCFPAWAPWEKMTMSPPLSQSRLPGQVLFWEQACHHIHDIPPGQQKSFPRHRLHRRRMHRPIARHRFPRHPHQIRKEVRRRDSHLMDRVRPDHHPNNNPSCLCYYSNSEMTNVTPRSPYQWKWGRRWTNEPTGRAVAFCFLFFLSH